MHALVFVAAGIASYYNQPGRMADGKMFHPAAHVCAMRTERFGERIEIINSENGATSWCVVSDRGPYVRGRIIDVSPVVRDELRMGGLARVRLYRQIDVPDRVSTPILCLCTPTLFPLTCTCSRRTTFRLKSAETRHLTGASVFSAP